MLSWQRIKALVRKELIQLRRDRPTLVMIIALPVVQLLLFGYAINMDPKMLPTAWLSRDDTFLTRRLRDAFSNSGYFKIAKDIRSDAEGTAAMQKGEVMFVVTIPENFTKDVIRGAKPEILIQADASDPSSIANAANAVSGIPDSVLQSEFSGGLAYLKNGARPFNIATHKVYNPEGFTRFNIIPGLIGMVLIFTGVMMTALALTRERERGTMENLLVMPVRPLEVMIGKITPFIFIGLFQAVLIVIIAKYLFHIPVMGDVRLLFGCAVLFIICNLSLGFLISAIAKNQTQALQMSIFVLLPSMMLTGFMFPFHGMPVWAQRIGSCIPLTYFVRIARGVMLKGCDIAALTPDILSLTAIVAVITALTLSAYGKTLD